MSLINLGDLAKPATTLIEKVSDAIGGIARPGQIVRLAKAENKADIARAEARIQISEMEERALQRMVREEGKKQENIENITAKAVPHLKEGATPEKIEDDWIVNLFDKARLVSDGEMQQIWAHLLAEEANRPGRFSKRTIDIVASLDRRDADLFTALASTVWEIGSEPVALVFDANSVTRSASNLTFSEYQHLSSLGLIITKTSGYVFSFSQFPGMNHIDISYFGRRLILNKPENVDSFQAGKVLLTEAGKQLFRISGATPAREFYEDCLARWIDGGWHPAESLSRIEQSPNWY